jgi:hypothetical protein
MNKDTFTCCSDLCSRYFHYTSALAGNAEEGRGANRYGLL